MTQGSGQVVRDAWAAFNAGDLETALGAFASDAEYHVAAEHPESRTCHGVAEIRAYLEEWQSQLGGMRFEIEDLVEHGDRVLAAGRIRGTGITSGIDVDVPLALVVTVRDGQVVRSAEYLDRDRAFEAAGLTP